MRGLPLLLVLVACSGPDEKKPDWPANAPDEGLLVAFVGDQGFSPFSQAVLKLIAEEGADLVIHSGDFDYIDAPDKWDGQITENLGEDYPYFASVGNHDVEAWPGYKRKLETRLNLVAGAECEGDYGVASVCHYRGLTFLLSGAGTLAGGPSHAGWLQRSLEADDGIWSVCSWHKNQNDMQVGEKGDEVGWEAYRACQDGGGIIATGHEHSYSRTLTLTDLGNTRGGHGAVGEPDVVEVGPGRTFAFVSGIAGVGLRDYIPEMHDDDTWWATIYAGNRHMLNGRENRDFTYAFGALFMEFGVDGDPDLARGYARSVTGDLIDEFTARSVR